MAPSKCALDAHEQPSPRMRAEWKAIAKLSPSDLDSVRIDDPRAPLEVNGFVKSHCVTAQQLNAAFTGLDPSLAEYAVRDVNIIHHPLLPGLLVAPSLIPEAVQIELLDRLLHRDLANPAHETNMHLHYELPDLTRYQNSFFGIPPDDTDVFMPKDPSVHKPLSARRVLDKRLHWVTLGGQYDWTNRVYPGSEPPPFPDDIGKFLGSLFPATLAQAAIVNLYSPGDTMMMHRDVSEETNKGLISVSIGCDGLFMIAPNGIDEQPEADDIATKRHLILRLRSGDVIYMSNEARYAWHGVPKVLADTCPQHLKDWPAHQTQFSDWKGWMERKRINLNVRQMKD